MMDQQQFWDILRDMPLPHPVSYRLYHDDLGMPLLYTMENLTGNYIEVDAETFALRSFNVRVKNNKLIKIVQTQSTKLVPGPIGTLCHPNNVAVVMSSGTGIQWSKKNYEQD